jgi:hypothetical protein
MQTEATPGSFWHACRTELTARDTSRALPMFVQLPPAAPGPAFAGSHRIFPADPANMRRVVVIHSCLMAGRIIVALIQPEMLRLRGSWLRPLDDNRIEPLRQQFGVVNVGSSNGNPERASIGFHSEAALYPLRPPLRGLGANEVPPKRALPSAASADCHCQLTPPNSSPSCTRTVQIWAKTPRVHQRWK